MAPLSGKGLFRIPREVFDAVVERISSHPVFIVPANVGRRAVPVDKQLACLLMRTGLFTVQNVRTVLGLSKDAVCQGTFNCIEAILDCYKDSIVMAKSGDLKKRTKQFSDVGFRARCPL